jgi:hypothetical protein
LDQGSWETLQHVSSSVIDNLPVSLNMARKKKRLQIEGGFVAMEHRLLDSAVFQSLSSTAKIVFCYFKRDLKSGHQTEVSLTISQAKKMGVCQSPSTFGGAKRELVDKGFLDPFEPGGLNQRAVFQLSNRWKRYGQSNFEVLLYKNGVGSKYFQTIWKDPRKRKNLIKARHGKRPSIDSV